MKFAFPFFKKKPARPSYVDKPSYVFGAIHPKPLLGWPEGKIRLRLRHDDFGKAWVRNSEGIRAYVIEEKNGCWRPGFMTAANLTPPRQ